MNFTITILHDRKRYEYKVELIRKDNRKEIYQLIAKNKTLTFTNNRPFLQSKKLKHWRPAWNTYFQQLIVKAIEEKIGIK